MEHLTLEQQIFARQQKGELTDCLFLFRTTSEDGKVTEKVMHGHKIILSAASKYFETNFKDEWKGTSPIVITDYEWNIFDKLIRAIYLSEISFENLDEALILYEAANFYKMDCVLELLRDAIVFHCLEKNLIPISGLAKTAWNYHDFKLMPFVVKYFCANTQKIIANEDFMRYSPEVINWLFQYEDLSVNEIDLVKALEKYLLTNKDVTKSMIKPAIETIRFLALKDEEFKKTTLLTQTEKDFLMGKVNINSVNLSKSKAGRKLKGLFSYLPSEIQRDLIDKLSHIRCWMCKQYHSVFLCQVAVQKYPMYSAQVNSLTYANGFYPKFEQISAQNMINILKELEKVSASSDFAAFANIDDVLKSIYVIRSA